MSNLLWKAYLEHDVDRCRNLLGNGAYTSGSLGAIAGTLGAAHGTSPRNGMKPKKSFGHMGGAAAKGLASGLTKADINSRDKSGMTILHRAVSSHEPSSLKIGLALIEHPLIDLSIQDRENGWTALHCALYFGNVSIARALLNKDSLDTYYQGVGNTTVKGRSLGLIKDNEGNSAFDVYNSTIGRRTLPQKNVEDSIKIDDTDDEDSVDAGLQDNNARRCSSIDGDEFYAFGSNKNLTLGFGDEDDRQYPEKITLKRPDHLVWRFYDDFLQSHEEGDNLKKSPDPKRVEDLPTLIRNKPIIIQDATLSKLHSAILTTDPESNLYMCGFGPGGRLGLGHDTTSFNYACVEGGALEGKKVSAVALGQNHTIAVTSEGEVMSWGTNTWGALGYTMPRPANDEEPVSNSPRQIFGTLKREFVIGVAASSIHSVAHTSHSLYTWGKNEGQLGLMDSDSRSLEAQVTPRKVGASLFTSTIQMVSAINRATICLLANHTVCVFTNYGYNIVKFPLYGGFANYHLKPGTLTTRYEAEPSHISLVTAGGDTIAAVSSRGDLFTLTVSHSHDSSSSASSTTNPAKIRSSLSQPQKIWSLRKGNWDGIKSVGVGENGSVILCTKAGAVWRRVKRTKVKEAFSAYTKNKDYKFQRVSGLTNVVAVRSNIFGGYAAIRKDCDIMTQISINEKTQWDEIAPLFCLSDLALSLTGVGAADKDMPNSWPRALPIEHLNPVKRAILLSPDFETDVARYLLKSDIGRENYNAEISSSLSETTLPVHSFMLAARSPYMRDALRQAKERGEFVVPEFVAIRTMNNSINIEFHGLDFITIFNLALYLYTDTLVDVWHFTRHVPNLGYRYRQIRSELMRLAIKLEMTKLEAAVRLMAEPERRMNVDFAYALNDPAFFIHGDAVIALDGGEVTIHSSLWRQRCPFFEGLFGGRAGGQWLAARREDFGPVRVDLTHIEPSTFNVVLKYVYTDAGTELFDDIVVQSIDEFCDVVMDVMGVANELMLDRLSQVCQRILGRFVNTRNICHLLNDVAPFAVREFKEAGLEYICLQLETMLDNQLLNDLDDDLLAELDDVVRENQLECLPFSKSDKAELLLHERHPSLKSELDDERQRRLRDIAFRLSVRDDEGRFASSFNIRAGSVDGNATPPSATVKTPKRSKTPQHKATSPSIRPNDSTSELMFDMEDDESLPLSTLSSELQPLGPISPQLGGSITPFTPPIVKSKGKTPLAVRESPIPDRSQQSTTRLIDSPGVSLKPWSSSELPSTKLNMREIMSQASSNQTSSLSMGISAQRERDEAAPRASKVSQKERRKQQQQALQHTQMSEKQSSSGTSSWPWQVASTRQKVDLNTIVTADSSTPPTVVSSLKVPTSSGSRRPRAASPDTRFSGQRGKLDISPQGQQSQLDHRPRTQQTLKSSPSATPEKLYPAANSRAEPTLQLSMADIIGQQKREQDLVKEAVAKRSLQEIQEEQAFQEWWDKESLKAQEQETARSEHAQSTAKKVGSRGRSRNARGGGGGRNRGNTALDESRKGKEKGDGQAVQDKDNNNRASDKGQRHA